MGNFADLKWRLPLSAAMVIVLSFLVWFAHIEAVKWTFVFISCALIVLGIWEFSRMSIQKRFKLPNEWISIYAVVWIIASQLPLPNQSIFVLCAFIFFLFFVTMFCLNFNSIPEASIRISLSVFAFLYLCLPVVLMLYTLLDPREIDGRIWFVYLIAVTKASDVGGYLIGKWLGHSKLAPAISPNKTIRGAIGGIVFSIFTSVLFVLAALVFNLKGFQLGFYTAIGLGFLVAIFGQLGDLSESLLKRDAKVKDSNDIPGVGGVLDLLDSLLFTAPIVYLFQLLL